jgi:MOSC domain-containing protein YiiM
MRLISVQRGTPRTEGSKAAGGPMERRFTSAIWKEPIVGPARITRLGVEGDAVANRRYHGGPDQALLAYPAAHYDSWRAEWGRDDLGPGGFGENLTVEGADEDGVCLGDQWGLGHIRLEVSAAREPCGTLARRHQMPELVKTVRRNGRGGWYLRVLVEGTVVPGAAIELLARLHAEWTVRRSLGVMVSGSADERQALLSCPAITRRWRERLLRPASE